MYGKFLVSIIIVVIAFTGIIAGTITTVVGQNQTINLTALLTPDTNSDTMDTTTTSLENITATNNTNTTSAAATASVAITSNMTIEDARELYLSVWNQTKFNATFSTFVEPFSAAGYGVYEERSNIFAPGETIVLYVEPVGFAHEQVTDKKSGSNNNTMLYLMNMTADYEISAANGTELQLIEDVQVGNITSHRPNTEMFLTLTLTPGVQPLPVGSYVITYSVTDEISDESFVLEKEITVAERE
jgi:cytoskeletal protein RodZ